MSWSESMKQPFPNSVAQKATTGAVLAGLVMVPTVAVGFMAHPGAVLAASIATFAVMSFVVFFQSDGSSETRTEALRRAVTAATVLTFLVLVAVASFAPQLLTTSDHDIDARIVEDFRWVVTVVVGFHFSTDAVSAYVAARYPHPSRQEDHHGQSSDTAGSLADR